MAGATYTPLATSFLTSTSANVTFSGISGSYTDLIIVSSVKFASGGAGGTIDVQFNSDTASNYSYTYAQGNGSGTATSARGSYTASIAGYGGSSSNSEFGPNVCHIMNYSNSAVYKTTLTKASTPSGVVQFWVSTWRNTAAITSIKLQGPYSFDVGSQFTVYGVLAA